MVLSYRDRRTERFARGEFVRAFDGLEAQQSRRLSILNAATDHVTEIGYDPSYGARPLQRLLQRRVKNELNKRLLRGNNQTGDHVLIEFDPDCDGENKIIFTKVDQSPIAIQIPVQTKQE